jgi:hypothetical protein
LPAFAPRWEIEHDRRVEPQNQAGGSEFGFV